MYNRWALDDERGLRHHGITLEPLPERSHKWIATRAHSAMTGATIAGLKCLSAADPRSMSEAIAPLPVLRSVTQRGLKSICCAFCPGKRWKMYNRWALDDERGPPPPWDYARTASESHLHHRIAVRAMVRSSLTWLAFPLSPSCPLSGSTEHVGAIAPPQS